MSPFLFVANLFLKSGWSNSPISDIFLQSTAKSRLPRPGRSPGRYFPVWLAQRLNNSACVSSLNSGLSIRTQIILKIPRSLSIHSTQSIPYAAVSPLYERRIDRFPRMKLDLDSIFLPPFKSLSFVLLSSYSWNTTQFNLNFLAWASFAFLLGTFSLAWADKQSHFFFNTELRASRWPEFFVELLFSMTSLSVWLVAANRVSYSVGDNDKIHFLIRYLAGTYERLENSSTFSFYLFT